MVIGFSPAFSENSFAVAPLYKISQASFVTFGFAVTTTFSDLVVAVILFHLSLPYLENKSYSSPSTATFSPDPSTMESPSRQGTVKIWMVTSCDLPVVLEDAVTVISDVFKVPLDTVIIPESCL